MPVKPIQTPLEVLIVEDEIDTCFLLMAILKKKNLQPGCVATLFEANKALRKRIPDILFLDNHLPDGYGIDFISHIRRQYPAIHIIMITAYDTSNDRDKAMKEGADHFIGKPLSLEKINNTMDVLIHELQHN
ncbi:MAG: response regulator [Chitinophagaceae bacterium]|nr:response regulator [Chitinophagaceae bacterium]